MNTKDKYSNIAIQLLNEHVSTNTQFVINYFVFNEFITFISRLLNYETSVEYGKRIYDDKVYKLIDTPIYMVDEIWDLYQNSNDDHKPLTFTDCSILITCKHNGIEEIYTFDEKLANFFKN